MAANVDIKESGNVFKGIFSIIFKVQSANMTIYIQYRHNSKYS